MKLKSNLKSSATRCQSAIWRVSGSQNRLFHFSHMSMEERPQSPFKVFYDTFKAEVKKSTELKENIKALQDETGRVADSDAFKKAKEAFDQAQRGSSAAGKMAKKTTDALGDAAYKAWESDIGKGVRKTARTSAEAADRVFEPVRKTQVYKDVSDIIDDGSSTSYGGYLTKEQREKLRKAELERRVKSGNVWRPTKENADAGSELIVTDSKPTGPNMADKWENFKQKSSIGSGFVILREKWKDSENGLISLIRTIVEKVSGFFAETEQAKAIKQLKQIDPTFKVTDFTKTLTNYIVPELLDAYIKNDEKALKEWLSEAPFNVWQANNKQFIQQGLFSDGRILDIRGVDIVTCKTLQPNDIPVIVASCRAQEIHLYRKVKTGDIAAGTEDHIQLSTYVMVLSRIPEEVDNKVTEGWKVVEFARGGSRPFH